MPYHAPLMTRCELDHLVIAASSLEAGVAYLEDKLGVTLPFGGKHPLMGTHNCLMQIGGGAFLELIAIDPEAPAPSRPRWFNLDDPGVQTRIAERPRLHTWVVRSDDLARAVSLSPVTAGQIEEGRRGDRVWNITIPQDGSMPERGLFPTLIEWPDFVGPASGMADLGCRLETLTVTHADPNRLTAALISIGADEIVDVAGSSRAAPPGLAATFKTPQGEVSLG